MLKLNIGTTNHKIQKHYRAEQFEKNWNIMAQPISKLEHHWQNQFKNWNIIGTTNLKTGTLLACNQQHELN